MGWASSPSEPVSFDSAGFGASRRRRSEKRSSTKQLSVQRLSNIGVRPVWSQSTLDACPLSIERLTLREVREARISPRVPRPRAPDGLEAHPTECATSKLARRASIHQTPLGEHRAVRLAEFHGIASTLATTSTATYDCENQSVRHFPERKHRCDANCSPACVSHWLA